MQEPDLVKKLKSGDDEAFRYLVDTYQKMVLNCAFKFVRDRETAQDLTQEVFLEVFESVGAFRGGSKLSTWLYRVTVSKSLNHLKHLKRKKRFAFLQSIFGADGSELRIAAPAGSGPAEDIENSERAAILQAALGKLPQNQMIAFTLSKYDEMSYQEIADVMNISIASVESLLHRAKTNLRKTLCNYYKKNV